MMKPIMLMRRLVTASNLKASRYFSTLKGENESVINTNNSNNKVTTSKEKVDCVVIGAGVVGLAIARQLSVKNGRDVLVLESASAFGTGTSSRNSEVVHAGIYYPPNSLKARLCVRGREMLYDYCKECEIPYKKIGKLIVATGSSDIPKLNVLMDRGLRNGVDGLKMMEGCEAKSLEPELQCVKALLSSASGIVDTHSLMLSLLGLVTPLWV